MSTIAVTESDFDQTVQSNDIVLVDFWAAWCGPCRQFGPVFEQVSEANPDVTFAKVDTDANQQLAAAAGITSIPTLMAFRDQILVYAAPGALPKANLEDLVSQVKALDMDAVRASIAEQKAEAAGAGSEAAADA